jgi:hypothetical protein
MEKTLRECLLYGLILWCFSASASALPCAQFCLDPDRSSHEIHEIRPGSIYLGRNTHNQSPSYTKLNITGGLLPDSAASWAMVEDNVTGLIWEVKTNMDGISNYNDPHDADNTYTWYDSNPKTNGGNVGSLDNGTHTEAFIHSLNTARFGGFSDWRLPTIQELAGLADPIRSNPAINTYYFPNTVSSWYWSSSTSVNYPYQAWGVGFRSGLDSYNPKFLQGYVRAVRSAPGQLSGLLQFHILDQRIDRRHNIHILDRMFSVNP